MVNSALSIRLFPFQQQAVDDLLERVSLRNAGQRVVRLKAPTGSGKTILLIGFVEEFLRRVADNVAFVWLCPGKGDLEEQSRDKMRRVAPHLETQSLPDALLAGFAPGTTTFINWELVTKSGNMAVRDSETQNLFDRIAEAHRSGVAFLVIIDEEHSNNTEKARAVLNAFNARSTVRVSATVTPNSQAETIEIDEQEVIGEGLITKAIRVNDGVRDNALVDDEYDYLLDLANARREAIAARYRELDKLIRPLVLIQFPNGRPETVEAVERKLESMGYTYDNGMVSKWMSGDKRDLPDNLTANDGTPVFLLMKQAISTGWDCPRAKILVKLREGMTETFTIQTIGRIRRMPEARHYDDELLDSCYVYTLDEKFKKGLLNEPNVLYELRLLTLKDKCRDFTLEKQNRDLDFAGLGEREVLSKIHDFMVSKYHLGCDLEANLHLLEEQGYRVGNEIIGQMLQGAFVHAEMMAAGQNYYIFRRRANNNRHSLELLHCEDILKSTISLPNAKTRTILERLFRKGGQGKNRLICLAKDEFGPFIINNVELLRRDFREATAEMVEQGSFHLLPKVSTFRIPTEDFFPYDPTVKREVSYSSNAYEGYTSGYVTSKVRSTCETLFEQYCQRKSDIDWVYKNGDKGQDYFSIVYLDAFFKQHLFYADYIVRKKDGTVWIIETKGGEKRGESRNIDLQIANKFNAFKLYSQEKNIRWGFVRDLDNLLYINNTEFALDLSNDHWVPLESEF